MRGRPRSGGLGTGLAAVVRRLSARVAGRVLSQHAHSLAPWLLALLLLPARPAFAQEAPRSGISVVGEGRVIASPDLARVVFGVERLDPSLAQALDGSAGDMQAVINRLVQLGINRDEIQTTRFSVAPVYDSRGDSPVLRGYRVSNAVSATIRDMSRVGSIIDAAVGAGATRVEGISFDSSRVAELKAQARAEAMANARAKAEQLARLAGLSLGPVRSIAESDVGDVQPVRAMAAVQAAPAATTPIEGGQLEIRTVVNVTWELAAPGR